MHGGWRESLSSDVLSPNVVSFKPWSNGTTTIDVICVRIDSNPKLNLCSRKNFKTFKQLCKCVCRRVTLDCFRNWMIFVREKNDMKKKKKNKEILFVVVFCVMSLSLSPVLNGKVLGKVRLFSSGPNNYPAIFAAVLQLVEDVEAATCPFSRLGKARHGVTGRGRLVDPVGTNFRSFLLLDLCFGWLPLPLAPVEPRFILTLSVNIHAKNHCCSVPTLEWIYPSSSIVGDEERGKEVAVPMRPLALPKGG